MAVVSPLVIYLLTGLAICFFSLLVFVVLLDFRRKPGKHEVREALPGDGPNHMCMHDNGGLGVGQAMAGTCGDRFARKDNDGLKSENLDLSDQQAALDIEQKADQA